MTSSWSRVLSESSVWSPPSYPPWTRERSRVPAAGWGWSQFPRAGGCPLPWFLFYPRGLGGAGVSCFSSSAVLCWWSGGVGLVTAGRLSSGDRTQWWGRGALIDPGGAGSPGSPRVTVQPGWHYPVGSLEPGESRNLSSLLPWMAEVGWSWVFFPVVFPEVERLLPKLFCWNEIGSFVRWTYSLLYRVKYVRKKKRPPSYVNA